MQDTELRRRELLERVIEMGKAVAAVTDWRACLEMIYWSVRNGLGFDRVGVFVYDGDAHVLRGAYGTDRNGDVEELFDWVHPGDDYRNVFQAPGMFRLLEDFGAVYPGNETMRGVGEHASTACWAGDRPVGMLSVDNLLTGRRLEPEQLDALRLFGGYAGLAMQNARLLAQARDAEKRYRDIFERAVEGIFQSTPDGRFVSVNPAMARIFGYDTPQEMIDGIVDLRHTYADPARRALLMRLLEEHGEVRGLESEVVRRDGSRIWISGSTHAVRDDQGRIVLLEGIIEDVTERKSTEAELKRTVARLEILHQIDRAILAEHAPEDIAAAALIRIRNVLPIRRASVTMIDLASDYLTLLAVSMDGETTRGPGVREPVEDRATVAALRRGQVVQVEDVLRLPLPPRSYRRLVAEGVRSWLIAPLMYQDELIGALNLGAATPGTFLPEHAQVAREVADQLAIAIQQARLMAQTEEALLREQRLNEFSRMISSRMDSQLVVSTAVKLAAKLLSAEAGLLAVVSPDGETMTVPHYFNFPGGSPPALIPRGTQTVWRIFDTGRPELLNDYQRRPGAMPELVQAGVEAVIGVPVVAGSARLGVMAFYALRPGQRFAERDLAAAESIGRQAGLALQNARLYEAVHGRVALLTALYEIGLDVSSQLDVGALLQTTAARAARLLDAPAATVYLHGDDGRLQVVATSPLDWPACRNARWDELAHGVAESGLPLVLPDQEANDVAAAAVPILLAGRVVGVLQAAGARTGQFGAEAIETMRLLAAQTAVAIQNARLFAAASEAEEALRSLNVELEQRVDDRTAQLDAANQELEAFSYSVSHDLRAPLRIIDGFSQALLEDYHERLDDEGRGYLRIVREECQRMGQLIDDLITLARVARTEIYRVEVDLTALSGALLAALQLRAPERRVEVEVAPGLTAHGDRSLLQIVLQNLLENAWKFTGRTAAARIVVGGAIRPDGTAAFFVRDNGAGFDMAYADKLFGAFQRLHAQSEFEGTGIGLATVKRIVSRHGGQVWAEAAVDRGATFFVELPGPP